MYSVTKKMRFSYAHRLLNYRGKCELLHGHNGVAEITLSSEGLDKEDMVYDFTTIKAVVSEWVAEHLDHKILLRKGDPLLPVLKEHGQACFVMDSNPTAERIAQTIFDVALSKGLPVSEVTVWETESSCATYHGKARGV
ncbi:MAG: 6-carboxytetrahydropterin synthase [Candidatus Omnitrophica bacterium]|nr:6-carboxytetrahydropterin synthase [Candidatus Omnitrophota bacterium]